VASHGQTVEHVKRVSFRSLMSYLGQI